MRRLLGSALFLGLTWLGSLGGPGEAEPRWWKGNTHTHTLWSDGDAPPEMAAAWYVEHGYDFLVLSDHNILSRGEKWFPVREGERSRLTPERLASLRGRFGEDAVEVRETEDGQEMRLRTLDELRARFERPGEFLFIEGEEVTASFRAEGAQGSLPVHINALNVEELVPPPAGGSAREVMNRSVDAILAEGKRSGRPVLAHINHPNFGWGLGWEDVAHVRGDRFFEVFNGHRGVRSAGDATHPSTEEMWDRALTLRLTELDLGLLYGVATDDAHEYWHADRVSVPGRGWVMVRATTLEPDAIVEAMGRGDFYASSGVTLRDFRTDGQGIEVEIEADEGVQYTTRFLGTRRGADGDLEVGAVLLETDANPARYEPRGDELYVRAVVTSSRLHPEPYAAGDFEMAWLQPVRPGE